MSNMAAADLSKAAIIPKRLKTVDLSLAAILGLIGENDWFRWHYGPEHSNLRLVNHQIKSLVDEPARGGPDFPAIVELLNNRNRFDLGEGICVYCHEHYNMYEKDFPMELKCNSCAANKGGWWTDCECTKSHRYGPIVAEKDPRLNENDQDFFDLPVREQAKRLLTFHRWCVGNFINQEQGENQDLTMVDPDMYRGDGFMEELGVHNAHIYNFLHHLLFAGWAHKELSLSFCAPGTYSPYRESFLGGNHSDWDGGHRDTFFEISQSFLGAHTPNEGEVKTIRVFRFVGNDYTLSQIQRIPETIRRCIEFSIDTEAVALLGEGVAESIDVYRVLRETYKNNAKELGFMEWMPSFGGSEGDFEPLTDFSDYNLVETKHILGTGLALTSDCE